MPKTTTSRKLIPKFYRRNFEDISMFFFVIGQKSIMPAISNEKAMYNYYRFIGEDQFNIESSISTYTRLQKEYNESTKTDK
jgi:hypothetical protein